MSTPLARRSAVLYEKSRETVARFVHGGPGGDCLDPRDDGSDRPRGSVLGRGQSRAGDEINIHRRVNICVSQQLLLNLEIHA